jgi:GxxExxY protein
MEVYNTLGPGLLESVYHKALAYELASRGVKVESEVPVEVYYKGERIQEDALRLDMVVEDQVVLELKSVEVLMPIHFKQLRTYLRLYKKEMGWLINFGAYDFNEGLCAVKLSRDGDDLSPTRSRAAREKIVRAY